jgi:PRC-barrel domain
LRAKLLATGLVIVLIGTAEAQLVLAQAMVPPTGMEDDKKPMTPEQRMQARFPQNVRVGDLIGLPVLDDRSSTLGHVSEVVRAQGDKIKLIVAYGGFLGWGTRPVAVPIEVIGIQGRELASLDMPPSEYATAPTWQNAEAEALPANSTIKIALSRR